MSDPNFGFWSPSQVALRGLVRMSLTIAKHQEIAGVSMKFKRFSDGFGMTFHPCQQIPMDRSQHLILSAIPDFSRPSLSIKDVEAIPSSGTADLLGLYMFEGCAFVAPYHEGPQWFSPHVWTAPVSSQHEKIASVGALRAALALYEELHARAKGL